MRGLHPATAARAHPKHRVAAASFPLFFFFSLCFFFFFHCPLSFLGETKLQEGPALLAWPGYLYNKTMSFPTEPLWLGGGSGKSGRGIVARHACPLPTQMAGLPRDLPRWARWASGGLRCERPQLRATL